MALLLHGKEEKRKKISFLCVWPYVAHALRGEKIIMKRMTRNGILDKREFTGQIRALCVGNKQQHNVEQSVICFAYLDKMTTTRPIFWVKTAVL